jgi:hypothetical protein
MDKKALIKEMKGFNENLEKHIKSVDLESVFDIKSKMGGNSSDELISVLTETLIDIRTEMNLLRKNLSVDVENMVKSFIKNEEKLILKQVNDIYNKIFLELKSNFAGYIEDINSDLVKLRGSIDMLNKEEIGSRFNDIENKFENIDRNLFTLSEINSKAYKLHEENFSKMIYSIERMEKLYPDFKNLKLSDKNIDNFDKKIKKTNMVFPMLSRDDEKEIVIDNDFKKDIVVEEKNSVKNHRRGEIIDLNKKIRALDALRDN